MDRRPEGVAPDIARALAGSAGVGVELVPFANPGALADAALDDVHDAKLNKSVLFTRSVKHRF